MGHEFEAAVEALVRKVLAAGGASRKIDKTEPTYRVVPQYESPHGSTISGTRRVVDVAILRTDLPEPQPYLFIECKDQKSSGSTEDKLFRAAEELRRDKLLGTYSVVAFRGEGFRDAYIQWALGEGFIHFEFLEAWLRLFFFKAGVVVSPSPQTTIM